MKNFYGQHKNLSLALLALGLMILAVAAQEIHLRWHTVEEGGLVTVGFDCQTTEPNQAEIEALVDNAIEGVLGPDGLEALISPGDKVVIKVNIVEPQLGLDTERGRGIISDPRVVRYVAEEIRSIIGSTGTADLKVVDACFTNIEDPSDIHDGAHGFRYAYYEQTGNTTMDAGDVCYDYDQDGILDGTSNATLVNLDAILLADRFTTTVSEPDLGSVDIRYPKFLRTQQQAIDAGEPNEYCDVHININTLKSHRLAGMTCAMKNIYGYNVLDETWGNGIEWDGSVHNTRPWHGGAGMGGTVPNQTTTDPHLMDQYLCAHHKARGFDLTILDCITANRRGPTDPNMSPNHKVHYILSNSIIAATDSIALETVAALFVGYDPASIEFIAQGQQDGIGIGDPRFIRVAGLDKFTQHRDWMMATYGSVPELEYFAETGEYQYPFPDGVGDAYKMADFDEPESVTLGDPVLDEGTTYTFTVNATESKGTDTGIARVELLVDGDLVGYETEGLASMPIDIAADMSDFNSGSHTCQVAIWDFALNCTLSNTVTFEYASPASTPLMPYAGNPTTNTLEVAITPGDGNFTTTTYAIHIDPTVDGKAWVNTDGSTAASEVWATADSWGTVTLQNLLPATRYALTAKAREAGDTAESPFGPPGYGLTDWEGEIITAGNLRFKYADGEIRRVMVGDKEVARRIYLGVRDSDWDTVSPTFSVEDVWINGDYSTITLEARCTNPNADYAWTGTITTIPNEIIMEVHGEAKSDFSTPRIGLNIFYGAESLKGQAYELDLTGGGTKSGTFPVPVAYDDNGASASVLENGGSFETLRYTVGGMTVEGGLDASSTFGLEDQRTYGDSSYKAYSGFESGNITTGETGWQRLKLRVTNGDDTQTPWNASLGGEVADTQIPAFVSPSALGEKPWEQFIRYKWGADATNAQMPFNPAAHLFDNDGYMENVPAILDQVQTVRDDNGGAVSTFRIDPIQIDPPYPNHVNPDPRHQQVFSAAWSVRAVKYLALGNVDEAGFEAGAGYFGETVRDAIAPYTGSTILETNTPYHGAYDVLATLHGGDPVFWVVNTTDDEQAASVAGLDNYDWLTGNVQRLNDTMAPTADFSSAVGQAVSAGAMDLILAPYEVVMVKVGDTLNIPAAPVVDNPTTASLDVALSTDGNSSVTEYALQISPAVSGDSWVQTDGSLGASEAWATSATWGTIIVSGLADATEYSFQAKARDTASGAVSDLGPAGSAQTDEALSVDPPAAPVITAVTTQTLDVTPQSGTGHTSVTLYALEVSPALDGMTWLQTNGETTDTAVWTTLDEWTTVTVTGLTPAVTYSVRAKAYDTVWSLESDWGVAATESTSPAVPTAPVLTDPEIHTVTVSLGDGDGNSADAEYALHISPAVDGKNWLNTDGTASATPVWANKDTWDSLTVQSLDHLTLYSFYAVARYDGVESADGPMAVIRTLPVPAEVEFWLDFE